MEEILTISDLHFTYPHYSETEAPAGPLFDGLNLQLAPGSFTVIAGIPESGKTSLSRIIAGLIPRYTGGELRGTVTLYGSDVKSQPPQELMDKLGLIFQNPDEQLLTTRVDSEIAFPLESLGLPASEIRQRVEKALEDFDLRDKAARNPASLSGGEKKRALFAALAAVDPSLWLLDETLDEIDPVWRRRILDYLADKGSTVLLFSSKFPDIYREYGAEYSILSGGRLIPENGEQQNIAIREGLLFDPKSDDGEAERRERDQKNAERENQALISVRNLEFSYPGENGFSLHIDHLEVYPGEVLTVAGPNGCGKTSLAKLLCGLYRPKSGNISLLQDSDAGQPTGDLSMETLRTRVAYIFQNPDYQIFLSSVKEELAYGLKEMGYSSTSIQEKVDEAIRLFKLPSPDSAPSLMSYGTRKRLQAATYWLLDRPVCVLDEADSGLSVRDFAEIIALFRSKNRAILVITHNEELAQRFSDRVLVMENGGIRPGERHD